MVVITIITIVRLSYKPTYNVWGHHIVCGFFSGIHLVMRFFSDSGTKSWGDYLDGPWDFAHSWLVTGDLLPSKKPNEIIHLRTSFP